MIQEETNQSIYAQRILTAKPNLINIESDKYDIYTGAISNNLKYVVSGGNQGAIKIWDFDNLALYKTFLLDSPIYICKFTDDSKYLFIGTYGFLYQFDADHDFQQIYHDEIHEQFINNLICISNQIIITSSFDQTIIKTDIVQKSQMLKIMAHNYYIRGLDYSITTDMIVSGSDDGSIKLWNGFDGNLIINQKNAHNNQYVVQVLFIVQNNQLVSLDNGDYIKIWNIDYDTKQLKIQKVIEQKGYNISLILEQWFFLVVGEQDFKVYSITGDLVRSFQNDSQNQIIHNTVQLNSFQAILIISQSNIFLTIFKNHLRSVSFQFKYDQQHDDIIYQTIYLI